MHELDLKTSVIGRRAVLQAFALLSLGGLIFGSAEARVTPQVVKSDVKSEGKSEYVVINGWVLPAQHFRPAQA